MSGSQSKRNHRREARKRAEEPEEFLSRASPKRVGRAFALLTRTYHGSRLIGKVRSSTKNVRLLTQIRPVFDKILVVGGQSGYYRLSGA